MGRQKLTSRHVTIPPEQMQRMSLETNPELEKPQCMPVIAPETFYFDMHFLRMMYHQMEVLGYYDKVHRGVHAPVFKGCIARFQDMFCNQIEFDFDDIGRQREAAYIQWSDLREAFQDGKNLPEIRLNMAERIFLTMEQPSSIFGIVWAAISYVAIILSLAVIIAHSYEGDVCSSAIRDPDCETTTHILSYFFSADYVVKLLCAPWSHYSLTHRDYLLEHVITDPKAFQPPEPVAVHATPRMRLRLFLSTPMNMIDLLSILPFWWHKIFHGSHVSLGFLRIFRLLRIVRIAQGGTFSRMLLVLGETLRKCSQSIVVLTLYIWMIALVTGAIIFQSEEDVGGEEVVYQDVPHSLWWVVTRMVDMHSSLTGGEGIPESVQSSLVIAVIGMFRGLIFVLPIGQITSTFKEAWEEQLVQTKLCKELEYERLVPLEFQWTSDPACPIVRIDLLQVTDDGSESEMHCYGSLTVPLYADKPVDCALWVGLHGNNLYHQAFKQEDPQLECAMCWRPSEDSKGALKLPKGRLRLQLLTGEHFPGLPGQRWACQLSVPLHLHGEDATATWHSGPSRVGSPRPEWDRDEVAFEIDWTRDILRNPPRPSTAPQKEAFQKRLLDLLAERGKRLEALEEELLKIR